MKFSDTKVSRVFYLRTLDGKPLWTNGNLYNLERKYPSMWAANVLEAHTTLESRERSRTKWEAKLGVAVFLAFF
jgi:hypothetical protein